MKLLGILLIVIVVALFVGCTAKSIIEPVVKKTHEVVQLAEATVQQANMTNYVSTAKSLVAPLQLVEKALTFVDGKLPDGEVKAVVTEVTVALSAVIVIIENLNEDTVDDLKYQIVKGIGAVGTAVEKLAAVLDIDLNTISKSMHTNAVEELDRATKELEALLK